MLINVKSWDVLKFVKSWEPLINVKPWDMLKIVKSCMLKNPNEC